MIVPMTRILSRWLKTHPSYSLNALLTLVEPYGDDRQPVPDIEVISDVDDLELAESYKTTRNRVLTVVGMADTDEKLTRKRGLIDTKLSFAVSFLWRDVPDATIARQEAEYVLRCAMDSLLYLNEPSVADEWRAMDGVQFLKFDTFAESRTTGAIGSATLMGSVYVTAHVARVTPI